MYQRTFKNSQEVESSNTQQERDRPDHLRVSSEEIQQAEREIIKLVQDEAFSKEIQVVLSNKTKVSGDC